MARFFRKIRKKVFVENKAGKYFLYAIGEIILIVIGILIAVSINNWNNHRVNKKEERFILEGIKEDIARDLIDLNIKDF